MFQKLNKTKLNQNKNKNKNCLMLYRKIINSKTTIFQCSKNYGIVRLVLTRPNVAPNMTGPFSMISIKDSESELNFVKFQRKIAYASSSLPSQREYRKLRLAMRCSQFHVFRHSPSSPYGLELTQFPLIAKFHGKFRGTIIHPIEPRNVEDELRSSAEIELFVSNSEASTFGLTMAQTYYGSEKKRFWIGQRCL